MNKKRKKLDETMEGIKMAQKIWHAVIHQGVQIMEHKAFISSGPFRQVVVEQAIDHIIVSSTRSLLSLALFLVSSFDVAFKDKNVPLVLSVFDKLKDTFLVIGLPSKTARNFNKKSFF